MAHVYPCSIKDCPHPIHGLAPMSGRPGVSRIIAPHNTVLASDRITIEPKINMDAKMSDPQQTKLRKKLTHLICGDWIEYEMLPGHVGDGEELKKRIDQILELVTQEVTRGRTEELKTAAPHFCDKPTNFTYYNVRLAELQSKEGRDE